MVCIAERNTDRATLARLYCHGAHTYLRILTVLYCIPFLYQYLLVISHCDLQDFGVNLVS